MVGVRKFSGFKCLKEFVCQRERERDETALPSFYFLLSRILLLFYIIFCLASDAATLGRVGKALHGNRFSAEGKYCGGHYAIGMNFEVFSDVHIHIHVWY